MRKPIIIALALVAAFAGVRCTTDGEGGERARLTEPPVLPSAASMAIPQFAETTGAEKSGADPIGFMNAGAAKLTVDFWTVVVALELATPVTIFALAHTTEPIPLPDSSGWQWVLNSGIHAAVLTSVQENGFVEWKMTVTANGGTPFVWFTGKSGTDGKSGNWVFNDLLDHKAKYGFKYALTNTSEDVKAEILNAGSPSFGSYIEWKSEGHMRYFEGYDAAKKDATLISYNSITGAGKLKDVDEGTTRCWDSRLAWYRDIDCAQLDW
jgi:hypothetical protein